MYVWKLFLQLLGGDDNGFDELRMNLDNSPSEDEDEMPSCLFSAIVY